MSKRYDAKGGQVMGVPITVRLRGEADLAFLRRICPLMAQSGHL
jgi:hypothetical protein